MTPFDYFIKQLNTLRYEAGNPSLGKLVNLHTSLRTSRGQSPVFSTATLSNLLTSKTAKPDLDIIEGFVEANVAHARERFGRVPAPVRALGNLELWQGRHSQLCDWLDSGASWTPERLPAKVGIVPMAASWYVPRTIDAELRNTDSRRGRPPQWHNAAELIIGAGGAGKTQVAARYVDDLWATKSVDLLIWASASSRASVVATFARAGIRVLGAAEGDLELAARRFADWLAETSKTVVIVFDDLLVPSTIEGFWPVNAASIKVIVTTRRRDAALLRADRRALYVDSFSSPEALCYLADALPDRDAVGAAELVGELGGLPLALAHAVAYVRDFDLSYIDYLTRFKDRRNKLRDLFPVDALPDGQTTPVAATWSLSIDLANDAAPAGVCRPMMEISAMLDPSGIPEALLMSFEVRQHVSDVVGQDIHEHDLRDALRVLHRLSLATVDSDSRVIRVHALVQRAIRDELAPDQMAAVASVAAQSISNAWTSARAVSAQVELRASAASLFANTEDALWASVGCHRLVLEYASRLGSAGLYDAAAEFSAEAAIRCEHAAGSEHPDTLALRHEHLHWSGISGDFHKAAALAAELHSDLQGIRGPEDRATLTCMHEFIRWDSENGATATSAVTRYEELAKIMRRVLGPHDPATLKTRNNLANFRAHSGDFPKAVADTADLLEDRIRVYGQDHPETLLTRYNLTKWKRKAESAAAVLDELNDLLPAHILVLGEDHPQTLNVAAFRADTQGSAGDADGAIAALKPLLAKFEHLLGPQHWETIRVREYLTTWTRK